jgi:membrane-bound serine protease (ClpP class)
MTRQRRQKISTFVLGMGLVLAGISFAAPEQKQRSLWLAEIRGTIDPASSSYLGATIRSAEADQAEAVIVELDTPGGLVSSVKDMAQAIDRSKVPVVVYVTPAGSSATSAGALLMLASHVAAMAPGTHIGAAHPVDTSGKDIPGAMGEKAVSDTAAFARGLAEIRGRNLQLAQAVVEKSKSLTAQEAQEQKLIEILVSDRSELIKKLNDYSIQIEKGRKVTINTTDVTIKTARMSWGQKLLHFLANPNIATLLMSLGLLCIYIELTTPGITVPGIIGGIAILVALMSYQMLPIRTGGLLLIMLWVVMLIGELFATTHGALAVGGTVSFILGILWVMDPTKSDLRVSPAIWIPAAITLGSGALLLAFAAARGRKLVQRALAQMGGGAQSGLAGYQGKVESVLLDGLSGKAFFRGELWNFKCSEPVKEGESVVVESVVGMLARVKKVRES